MAAILDFRALKREKNWHPIFFLCLYHILTESGEFLLLPKKIHEILFHANEPTLGGWSVGYCFAETSGLNATTRKVMESKWWFADVI